MIIELSPIPQAYPVISLRVSHLSKTDCQNVFLVQIISTLRLIIVERRVKICVAWIAASVATLTDYSSMCCILIFMELDFKSNIN